MKTILMWIVVISVTGCFRTWEHKLSYQELIKVAIKEHNCTPTNDFVGQYGDRLYMCPDGLKYKDHQIYSIYYDGFGKRINNT